MSTSITPHGYDANFDPPLKKRLECPICLLAQREPVQTPCGHRFCMACIGNALKVTGPRCPIDNMFLSHNQLFVDNYAKREVLSLTVLCDHVSTGCDWNGELRNLSEHLTTCEFVNIICPYGCKDKFLRNHLTKHQIECDRKPVQCAKCDKIVASDKYDEHLLFCPKMPSTSSGKLTFSHKLDPSISHSIPLAHSRPQVVAASHGIILSQHSPINNHIPSPVITQQTPHLFSSFLVYPSLLSTYISPSNIITYSQLGTSPINFPSAYVDNASYFILEEQNPTSTASVIQGAISTDRIAATTDTGDIMIDPHIYNIQNEDLAQSAEAVLLLNHLSDSSDRTESHFPILSTFSSSRVSRTRRSHSARTQPYSIHHDRGVPNASHRIPESTHNLPIPLHTVIPSISATVVYPTATPIHQQFAAHNIPALTPATSAAAPRILLTSLESATNTIINNGITAPPQRMLPTIVNTNSETHLAVIQGAVATALPATTAIMHSTQPVLTNNGFIPPLSLQEELSLNRTIIPHPHWEQTIDNNTNAL